MRVITMKKQSKFFYNAGFSAFTLAVLLISFNSVAGEGVRKLKAFHKTVNAFEAKFDQVLKDKNHVVLQTAMGSMSLKRPGKFYWNYQKPDKQLIISNGKKIWIYDQELEQVTIKTLTKGLGKSPARVLTETAALEKEFILKDLGKKNGIDWVELKPKDAASDHDHFIFPA